LKKTVVITGGRSEVARAAGVALARGGARVVLVSSSATATAARDEIAKRGGSPDVHLLLADMSLLSSVRELARQINDNWHSLAAIIHHGVHHDLRNRKRDVTIEGFERFWVHNHLSPFLLTHLLKDSLVKGHGRVLTVGSPRLKVYPRLTVDVSDVNYERRSFSPLRAFYQSKIAQIQFALALERHWKAPGVVAKAMSVPSVGADTMRRGKLPWYRRLAHTASGRETATPRKIGELYAVMALSPAIPKVEIGYLDRHLHAAWAPTAAFDVEQQDATWKISEEQIASISKS
jgi:NAD(P)-dependent dehydrogenase (short-subunit alcohol dehydrogenase family)